MSELPYFRNREYLFQIAVLSTWHVSNVFNSLGLHMLVCCYKWLDSSSFHTLTLTKQWSMAIQTTLQFFTYNDLSTLWNWPWILKSLICWEISVWTKCLYLLCVNSYQSKLSSILQLSKTHLSLFIFLPLSISLKFY